MVSGPASPGAELALDAMPLYDGWAVGGGRVVVSLQDGHVLCLGKAD